jgi:dienelactone hydrolase
VGGAATLAARAARAAVVAALLVARAADAQWPWRDLEPGPHPVGYRVAREYDRTRTFVPAVGPNGATSGAIDRLVEIRLWYPATASSGTAMPYRGYRDAVAADGPTGPLTDTLGLRFDRDARLGAVRSGGDSTVLYPRVLEARTGVVRDAPPAPGPFPAIVYAPGRNDSSDDNVALFEYLASHGYVVGAIASQGVNTVTVLGGATALEMSVRDMEWALARLLALPQVDASRIGATGFSFGGTSALALAMRNVRVRAVAALDPSFTFPRGSDALRAWSFFDSTTFLTPVMVAGQRRADWSTATLDALRHAPRFEVRIGGTQHADFCSYAMVFRSVIPGALRDSTLRFRADVYIGLAAYVRDFLDAYVKGDGAKQLALRSKPRWRSIRNDDVDFSFQLGSPIESR